jgi:hypothetical protein
MSAHSELNDVLHEVVDRLDRTSAHLGTAVPMLEQAKETLNKARRDSDGWHPVELDRAIGDARRAIDLVAKATLAVRDYATRL